MALTQPNSFQMQTLSENIQLPLEGVKVMTVSLVTTLSRWQDGKPLVESFVKLVLSDYLAQIWLRWRVM